MITETFDPNKPTVIYVHGLDPRGVDNDIRGFLQENGEIFLQEQPDIDPHVNVDEASDVVKDMMLPYASTSGLRS